LRPYEVPKRYPLFLEHPSAGSAKSLVLYDDPKVSSNLAALPVPPPELMQYGENEHAYLAGGRKDSETLREILRNGGFDPAHCKRFMEFGCSNGRVLRWFTDWAQSAEAWGVDINSFTVLWAARNLRPPFKFAVTTTAPHLPFCDNFYDLVFCFSIFTHIDDMFLSWMAELRRVLRPAGYLFITIHDEKTVELLLDEPNRYPDLTNMFMRSEHVADFQKGRIGMLSIMRDTSAMVFYKRDFFLNFLSDMFDVVSVKEQAMADLQTGILVRKK
jgi:SAM-dependent methyltransferase